MNELENVKAGDTVIYYGVGMLPGREVQTVDRTTATQVIVRGLNYRKVNGRRVGGTWRSGRISIPEAGEIDEIYAEQKQRCLARQMESINWRNLSIEVLEKIAACLPPKESS